MRKVEFVICVEKGYFENQAKVLISSIRKLAGPFSDAPIYCYKPRKRYSLNKSTIKFLEENEVVFVDLELNRKFRYFVFANKTTVCAYHEKNSQADVIAYFDCDSLILNNPFDILNLKVGEVNVRPEDGKGIGTSRRMDDEFAPHWKMLYKELKVENITTVWSIRDYKEMLAHYNAGQIITHRMNNLFSQWNDNLSMLLNKKKIDKNLLVLSDQTILSATISQLGLDVKQQDVRFNFPVNLFAFDKIENPLYNEIDFSTLISFHYHNIFQRGVNPVFRHMAAFDNGVAGNFLIEEFGLLKRSDSSKLHKMRKKLDYELAKLLYC